jgi:putative component of membrane protein insertase Oxa1/YidC/SpoIIIJ protein YidD
MFRTVSVGAIEAYQKYLSPRKGFSCAMRLEDGTSIGCSGYAKIRIGEVGFFRALPDIKKRLNACRDAAEDRAARRRKRRDGADNVGDTCDCIGGASYCGSGQGTRSCMPFGADAGTDACGSLDCGGLDCSGVDCGGCDCGGGSCS